MAIRVRKLAKRLGKTPKELLGVLQAIGIDRYRSPEDMLSSTIEQKLVGAVRSGVKPLVVEPQAVRRNRPEPEVLREGFLPGVKPAAQDPRFEAPPSLASTPPRPQAPNPPEPAPAPPEPAPAPKATVSSEPVASSPPAPAPARPADPGRDLLAAERAALAAEREKLVAAREALAAERALLEASQVRRPGAKPLADVLEGRGLMGSDESERAIRALAESRRIAEILPYLRVEDAEGLHRYLRDTLLLVDGKPPEGISGAMVAVSPERSEVPGAAEWRRLTGKISESLMLLGARRVTIVGGPSKMHRLLANAFDPRIEVRFRPTRKVVAVDAEADVSRTDSLVLWDVEVAPEAQAIYAEGRTVVTQVVRPNVRLLLETWARDLADA